MAESKTRIIDAHCHLAAHEFDEVRTEGAGMKAFMHDCGLVVFVQNDIQVCTLHINAVVYRTGLLLLLLAHCNSDWGCHSGFFSIHM